MSLHQLEEQKDVDQNTCVESSQDCSINNNACMMAFEEEEVQNRRERSMECSTSSNTSDQSNEEDFNEVTSNYYSLSIVIIMMNFHMKIC